MIIAEANHNLITDLTIGQLLGVIATLIVIIGIVRSVNPIMHRLNNLLDDWFGEKSRPGVPERKGVMTRLSDQDAAIADVKEGQADQDKVLNQLRRKVEPLVDNTQKGNHQEVLSRLDHISATTANNLAQMDRLEYLLNRHIRESRAWLMSFEQAVGDEDFQVPPWPDLPDNPEVNRK